MKSNKWRLLSLYAIILVVLVSYFFVFEVYKKRKTTEAKEAEKKVFSVNAEEIREITISENSEVIALKKENDKWLIFSPVETETDGPAVLGFVNTLADLKVKKWVGQESDLSPFGLDKPAVTISAKESQKTCRLVLGSKTPTEDGIYAMAFVNDAPVGKEPVFVIDISVWGILNKGLYDLRRKELARFEDPQVKKIDIRWRDDPKTAITILRETEGWKLPDHPDIKVKKARVDHIVDQIRWLRAQSFVGNSKIDAQSFNLAKPVVDITLELSNREPLRIQLGSYQAEPNANQQQQQQQPPRLEAFSSELPFVVLVDRYIMNELPRKPEDLLDRSLLAWKEDDIGKIFYSHDGESVEYMREEGKESEWKWKKASEKSYKKLKEGWRIRSVVWAASDVEYETKKESVKAFPDKFAGNLKFYNRDGKLLSEWVWQDVSSNPKDSSTVWVKNGESDEIQVFTVPSSRLKNLTDRLKDLEGSLSKS
jgi:hypothetical protein